MGQLWADSGSKFLLADACNIARGMGHRSDVVLLLGRRPKRWPSSGAALGMVSSFAGGNLISIFSNVDARRMRDVESILELRWFGVVDGGPALNQRWFGVACLLGSSCIAHDINLINSLAAARHCAGVVLIAGPLIETA